MIWFYEWFFPVVWIVFLLYWQIRAIGAKTTQRLEPRASRLVRAITFVVVTALLLVPGLPIPWLYHQLWPQGLWAFWIGAGVMVAGLLFCVWARNHLGRNWSRSVTIKNDHELITSGPYGMVRHPIYTGLLMGFVGTAIALGQVRGIVGLALIFIVLWAKLRMEEAWMRSEFGETYAAYAHRTAALVPYVL